MILILFFLASVGMSHIIVDGSIFDGFREGLDTGKTVKQDAGWLTNLGIKLHNTWLGKKLNKIVQCYQCCGTWCGGFLGLLIHLIGIAPFYLEWWQVVLIIPIYAFSASYAALAGAALLMYLQSFGNHNE